ncbi:MAG: hypothetical protein COB81_11225 [Flavobacteriaceae bacterium]|nr:MAG: hypothetical protein COB81_11225 [Flavobacteriaceae bacterium]
MFNMSTTNSFQQLSDELTRYKTQLEALQNSDDYVDHHEQKEQLGNFYKEKINRLQFKYDASKAKNIETKATLITADGSTIYIQRK